MTGADPISTFIMLFGVGAGFGIAVFVYMFIKGELNSDKRELQKLSTGMNNLLLVLRAVTPEYFLDETRWNSFKEGFEEYCSKLQKIAHESDKKVSDKFLDN